MTEAATLPLAPADDGAVLAYVGPRAFARGRQYARRNAVFDGRVRESTLLAKCAGTQVSFYDVWATLEGGVVKASGCQCHVGASGGRCKHVAAVLLAYEWSPDAFLPVESIEAALRRYDRRELVTLIERVVALEPDLAAMVETPTRGSRGKHSVDGQGYQRQIATLFARAAPALAPAPGGAPPTPPGPPPGVASLVRVAHGALQAHAYERAAAIYRGVYLEGIDNYESFADPDGRLDRVLGECGDGLAACLVDKTWDASLRIDALRALVDGFRFGLTLHQLPARETVATVLRTRALKPELERVWEIVREDLALSPPWERAAWGKLLLRVQGDYLDDDAYIALCRETGCTYELVERMLERGRVDEAFEAADTANDAQLVGLAEAFARAGQSDAAEAWLGARLVGLTTPAPLVWLGRRAAGRGDSAAALDYAERAFRMQPMLEHYRLAKSAAGDAETRARLRERVLSFVEPLPVRGPLSAAILLDDGDVEPAVEVALRSLEVPLETDSPAWQERVARAAESSFPGRALEVYRRCVERLVERRGRPNYVEATVLLEVVHSLYRRLGDDAGWSSYANELRATHRRLRAFIDELDAAGL